MNIKGKSVLITGASAGIGEACAEVFAEAGARLILMARRQEKLAEVSKRLFKLYGAEIYSIGCDITKYDEIEQFIHNLPKNWSAIDVLINNAGKARGFSKIQDGNLEDWEEMIDTNIKGLLYISKLILSKMVEQGFGHVINIGSIAGREVYPNGNVYCGTKAAVAAISKGMVIDLNGTGVRVSNIEPGLVETEFAKVRFHGDEEKAKTVYEGYTPLTGRDIAETVLFCATRPSHVMIQDVLITPTDQATVTIVKKKM
ncbi:SDR family NAD(P)-dependent oxidoreductase [Bacteroidota bacterium]